MIYDVTYVRGVKPGIVRMIVEVYEQDDSDCSGVYEIAIPVANTDDDETIGNRIRDAIRGMEDTWLVSQRLHGKTFIVTDSEPSALDGYLKAEGGE